MFAVVGITCDRLELLPSGSAVVPYLYGESAELKCKAPQNETIKWKINGQHYNDSQCSCNITGRTLLLRHLTPRNAGNVTCHGKSSSAHITITVTSKKSIHCTYSIQIYINVCLHLSDKAAADRPHILPPWNQTIYSGQNGTVVFIVRNLDAVTFKVQDKLIRTDKGSRYNNKDMTGILEIANATEADQEWITIRAMKGTNLEEASLYLSVLPRNLSKPASLLPTSIPAETATVPLQNASNYHGAVSASGSIDGTKSPTSSRYLTETEDNVQFLVSTATRTATVKYTTATSEKTKIATTETEQPIDYPSSNNLKVLIIFVASVTGFGVLAVVACACVFFMVKRRQASQRNPDENRMDHQAGEQNRMDHRAANQRMDEAIDMIADIHGAIAPRA
jgi:hypothetical protein